jgi:hypothetical protein
MKLQINNENYDPLLKNREDKTDFYKLVRKRFAQPFIERYFDVNVLGQEKVPEKDSCIFVTHHCLYFDSILLGAVFNKKIHGWIAENVFLKRRGLYERLELIPVRTDTSMSHEERNEIMRAYQKTRELSIFWLRNTSDAIATTNDGLAECCLNKEGSMIELNERKNYSGAVNLAYEANSDSKQDTLVFPISCWIPKEHRKKLLIAEGKWGWKSLLYLEKQKKIPCGICINNPLSLKTYDHKKKFQDEIRKEQIDGYNFLEKISKS